MNSSTSGPHILGSSARTRVAINTVLPFGIVYPPNSVVSLAVCGREAAAERGMLMGIVYPPNSVVCLAVCGREAAAENKAVYNVNIIESSPHILVSSARTRVAINTVLPFGIVYPPNSVVSLAVCGSEAAAVNRGVYNVNIIESSPHILVSSARTRVAINTVLPFGIVYPSNSVVCLALCGREAAAVNREADNENRMMSIRYIEPIGRRTTL